MDFRDYLDELTYENEVRDEELRDSKLSKLWSRVRRKKDKADEVVYELLRIRDTVRNIVKIHGVPRGTTIALQTMGPHGLSGFMGKDKTKPFIYLSRKVYDMVPEDSVVDVYCGIGLHEASHLNHTKLMFDRMLKGELKAGTPRAIWEGLLEDERIERFVKEESPGYFPFIQKTKKALYESKELGGMLTNWDSASDLHRFNALVFCYIRMPHLLKKKHKKFKLIDGDCVYQSLQKIIDKVPTTEHQIAYIGQKLEEYYKKVLALYTKLSGTPEESIEDFFKEYIDMLVKHMIEEAEAHASEEKKEVTEEEKEKIKKSAKTKFKIIKIKHDGTAEEDKEYSEKLGEYLTKLLEISKSTGTDIRTVDEKDAKTVDKKSKPIKETIEELEAYRIKHGKFSIDDIGRMTDRLSGDVTGILSKSEELELAKAEDERLEFFDSPANMTKAVSTCVTHCRATPEVVARYNAIHDIVKNDVQRMRRVFAFRLGDRVHNQNEMVEGKLHRRMISKLAVTNRIFHTSYTKRDKGIALCLLLDESGSMGSVSPTPSSMASPATHTSKIAVLIAEALQNVPYVELEVYSYSSYDGDNHNLLKYLYGKDNKNIKSIGAYYYGHQNYDHAAIEVAGKLFKKNTTHEKKVMIVISDGNPCGNGYGGSLAKQAVQKEVRKLEQEGMFVMQIAITDHVDSNEMFKHWLKFTDMPNLTNKLRTVITGMIRAAT